MGRLWRVLIGMLLLASFSPALAQEHCVSPDAIREHVGKAVIADWGAADTIKVLIATDAPEGFQAEEIIAVPAADGAVALLFFHDGCGVWVAPIAETMFRDLRAYVEGDPA